MIQRQQQMNKHKLQTREFDEIAILRTQFPFYPRKQMDLFRLSDEVGLFSANVSNVKLHCVGRFLNKSRTFFFSFSLKRCFSIFFAPSLQRQFCQSGWLRCAAFAIDDRCVEF